MSQILIVGSSAMHRLVRNSREPKDLDVFTPDGSWGSGGADVFWHPRFGEWWIPEGTDRFASLNELYTIKVSHAYWELGNGSWSKHMWDMVQLKKAGARLLPRLHQILYEAWEERHGKKRVNLNMESDRFFADAVKRKYDHDSIHASVAYGNEPMYVRVLKPGKTVAMDMDKVKAMKFQDQVKLFREEVYATALERVMIPNDYMFSPRHAYDWALKRTIISLTKGWSARFIVDNYETFRNPDVDYVARHLANADKLVPLEV